MLQRAKLHNGMQYFLDSSCWHQHRIKALIRTESFALLLQPCKHPNGFALPHLTTAFHSFSQQKHRILIWNLFSLKSSFSSPPPPLGFIAFSFPRSTRLLLAHAHARLFSGASFQSSHRLVISPQHAVHNKVSSAQILPMRSGYSVHICAWRPFWGRVYQVLIEHLAGPSWWELVGTYLRGDRSHFNSPTVRELGSHPHSYSNRTLMLPPTG